MWVWLSTLNGGFVCVEVLQPSQPIGAMSSVVSLPNYTFTGRLSHIRHKLWTKICEIRQTLKGDLTKFCEISLNITLKLLQYSLKCFSFMYEACDNHNNV